MNQISRFGGLLQAVVHSKTTSTRVNAQLPPTPSKHLYIRSSWWCTPYRRLPTPTLDESSKTGKPPPTGYDNPLSRLSSTGCSRQLDATLNKGTGIGTGG